MSLLATLTMWAAQIDVNTAHSTAMRWMMSQHAGGLYSSHNKDLTLAHVERSESRLGAADYYVFNASDGSAFVLVSGDDRIDAVLGYGDGTLDMNNLPCNLRWLLGMYKEQIEYLHAHPGVVVAASRRATESTERYLPMLTSDWSQGSPFNDQCPIYDGEHCVTGCVATAMAQVMYYWRYPESCQSIPGYSLQWTTLSSLPATTFDWDNMIDLYTEPYTVQQGEAVAKLMRYCGQASNMNYGVDGSGTTVYAQLIGIRRLGYNRGTAMVDRDNYSAEDWNNMMLGELAAGNPILYSGSGSDGGHAFVVDGYDGAQNKYHINWGWASRGNGYFALGGFVVLDLSFNNSQQMLLGVVPATSVPATSDYDFEADGIYYQLSKNVNEAIVTCKDSHYRTYEGHVVIPEQVMHGNRVLKVTAIGDNAFRNCEDLTGVTIPATVKTIGDRAFRSCPALTRVDLPAGLETIGRQAFTNCLSLDYIYLPSSLRKVGDKAFLDCLGLKRVDIDGIQSWIDMPFVGRYANPLQYAHHLFVDGVEIKHLEIPEGVTAIPAYRFMGMAGMTSMSLPSSLRSIGQSAFAQCNWLGTVTLPDSLVTVDGSAFKDCPSLRRLIIPASVNLIGTMAFANCGKLARVTFMGPVEEIQAEAFKGCSSLSRVMARDIASWVRNGFKDETANPLSIAHHLYIDNMPVDAVVIPDSVTMVGDYAFYNFTDLTSLSIGNRLTSIGTKAFALCAGLKQVTIGDRVAVIGEKAFSTCSSLQSLTIGSGVTSIGDKAFVACSALDEVICRAAQPPVNEYQMWFSNATFKKATLKVPSKSLAAYRSAKEWKNFTNIIGINITDLLGDVNADGELSIADINALINAILKGTDYSSACDVNGDNEVSLADINALIGMILME